MRRWATTPSRLRFQGPAEDLALGARIRRELFLVSKEAVHNLARRSGCREASIDLRSEGDSLVLRLALDFHGKQFG